MTMLRCGRDERGSVKSLSAHRLIFKLELMNRFIHKPISDLVEREGIEPSTSALQKQRSTSEPPPQGRSLCRCFVLAYARTNDSGPRQKPAVPLIGLTPIWHKKASPRLAKAPQ